MQRLSALSEAADPNSKIPNLSSGKQDSKMFLSKKSVKEICRVDFNDLVDLKTEKDQFSGYDVDFVAKYHWK